MTLTNINVCRNCPNRRMVELNGRTVTCHSVCPEYKEARAKRDAQLKANLQQTELVRGYFVDKIKGRQHDTR